MNHMRSAIRLLFVAGVAAVGISCGDVVRDGRSPVFLVIESLTASRGGAEGGVASGFLLSDVLTYVTEPPPCSEESPCPTIFNDTGSVTFRLSPKNITIGLGNAPSTNNDVTISRYRVDFRRSDGRNTPGVDVPYGFDGGVTGTVPAGGTLGLNFELVRHVAKRESPLVQLVNSPNAISTIATITFYGRDQVGNEISATGSISVAFGTFGDE
jgi:hypothetical protein